jgi:hypothetical protein
MLSKNLIFSAAECKSGASNARSLSNYCANYLACTRTCARPEGSNPSLTDSPRTESLTVELAIVATLSYNNFVGVTGVGENRVRGIAAHIIGASTYKKQTKIEV